MTKQILIQQIHTNTLACEPLIRRVANGELLCVCQCDGTREPCAENRVYAFHSKDNGLTWSDRTIIRPEDGRAVYCTELSVEGDEITAYLSVHPGTFFKGECIMMKSFDNGYTWKEAGHPPFFSEFTFIRAAMQTTDGRTLIPYQYYPLDKSGEIPTAHVCETGVLIKDANGQYQKHTACEMAVTDDRWVWSEPTIAELSDGTIAMLMRKDHSGWLYRCDSKDKGRTWSEYDQTNIPNPGNKPRLIPMDHGRVALVHTPSQTRRYPLELWISDDDMNSWTSKIRLTDFPGTYHYSDGFYEDGHIRLVVEHNRHTILYFDVTL